MYNFNAVTRAYLTQTIDFVRRLVFKSEQVARAQNAYLTSIGYVVTEDLSQWKYYLNLNGQYHESDTVVTVLSSDTGERIPFTKAGLVSHPLTQQDYSPDGERHAELMADNPEHRGWLDRVMDPIDIQTAMNANDYQILSYDSVAVAPNETSFISRLQEWLYGWEQRWHEYQMAYREELHSAAERHILLNSMTLAILTLRNEQARTTEVDDFHLWAYLGSRYRLDRFRDALGTEQALWLYRNLEYLRYHVGKESTFRLLLENIATPNNVAASKFDLINLFEENVGGPEASPIALRRAYEEEGFRYGQANRDTLERVLGLTRRNTERNEQDYSKDLNTVKEEMFAAERRTVPTGQIQLKKNISPSDVFFNFSFSRASQWLYWAANGAVMSIHELSVPGAGKINVSSKEAVALYQYALARSLGLSLDEPLPMELWRVLPLDFSSRLDNSVADPIRFGFDPANLKASAKTKAVMTTSDEFEVAVADYRTLFSTMIAKRFEQNTASGRAAVDTLIRTLFPPVSILPTLPENLTYAAWLEEKGITSSALSLGEWDELQTAILTQAAGVSLSDAVSNAQAASIEIMKIFSPYNVVFTEDHDLKTPLPYSYREPGPERPSAKLKAGVRLPSSGPLLESRHRVKQLIMIRGSLRVHKTRKIVLNYTLSTRNLKLTGEVKPRPIA